MPTRIAFQVALRAAAVEMLRAYGQAVNIKLSVYSARPATITPPHAFIDSISETITFFGAHNLQRTPRVEVIVAHGLFDSKEAADQRDEFVDGFIGWVADNWHAAGGATLIGPVAVSDIPSYFPDWPSAAAQGKTYYATQITLEGFANT
jgi:hypothetical protein